MRPLEAQSTAFKALPPARGNPKQPSLVLFYAYREPAWSAAEHSRALKTFIKLCEAHDLKGRGRCAPEGVNCTLTGGQQQIRSFCTSLREWDSSLFGPVDFKITDGLQKKEAFKRLTIRKTEELVGYGLGQAQPQLATSKATHLDAIEYHKALEDPDAIVVDVRNQYETEIGRKLTVHESNCRDASPHGSIMTSTPSTRRQLDGVAVGAPDSLVD
jgi:predicted sulfurtransferase